VTIGSHVGKTQLARIAAAWICQPPRKVLRRVVVIAAPDVFALFRYSFIIFLLQSQRNEKVR
jgi:hypothetical protein